MSPTLSYYAGTYTSVSQLNGLTALNGAPTDAGAYTVLSSFPGSADYNAATGLANFTIGQRRGLGVTAREPLHVLRLDAARNAVVVGPAAALERDTVAVEGVTFQSGAWPEAPFEALVKLRYKAPAVPATVTLLPDARAEVRLRAPQRAITPGQAAVFYDAAAGEQVLGGGLIAA